MHITWAQVWSFIVGVSSFIAAVKVFFNKYKPIVEPMIKAAEIEYMKACADGTVTKDERKAIVMAGVKFLEDQGKLKMNFVKRWAISKLVDWVAEHMDDIKVDPVSGQPIPPTV